MLRSYLELLEKKGGGTLILSAGTYEICNTLYVASNITILLEDGVVIRKIEDTGTASMKSSFSLFQLVAPSKSKIPGAYSAYDGESNIRLLGEGNATIDMNYVSGAIGIIFAHNSGITVSGINFTSMQSGHFIELDASKNVIIENNTFSGHRPSRSGIKEAINLDTPDRSTGGIHVGWTSYDQTPNLEVIIRNNRFSNLERAIGTHKYSEGKYHENIQILNNTIENTVSDAIRIINWRTPTITGNTISNVKEGSGTERAILASGLIHPDIRDNTFKNVARPIQLMPWKNNGAGGEYNITYNEVDYSEIELMLKNILEQVREPFIRVNQVHNVFNASTLRYYYSSAYKR
jgi:polygalacturonase